MTCQDWLQENECLESEAKTNITNPEDIKLLGYPDETLPDRCCSPLTCQSWFDQENTCGMLMRPISSHRLDEIDGFSEDQCCRDINCAEWHGSRYAYEEIEGCPEGKRVINTLNGVTNYGHTESDCCGSATCNQWLSSKHGGDSSYGGGACPDGKIFKGLGFGYSADECCRNITCAEWETYTSEKPVCPYGKTLTNPREIGFSEDQCCRDITCAEWGELDENECPNGKKLIHEFIGSSEDQCCTDDLLYYFQEHNFTNCGSSKNTGPRLSNCKTSYDKTGENPNAFWNNTDLFDVTNGIQIWTVPQTGNYEIEAKGASEGCRYGRGAIVKATFNLQRGDKYMILVGQEGSEHRDYSKYDKGCGGGGGTFMVKGTDPQTISLDDVVIVAGGGGGSTNNIYIDEDENYRGGHGSHENSIITSGGSEGDHADIIAEASRHVVRDEINDPNDDPNNKARHIPGGAGGGGLLDSGEGYGHKWVTSESDETSKGKSFISGGEGGVSKQFDRDRTRNYAQGGFGGGGSGYYAGGGGGGIYGGSLKYLLPPSWPAREISIRKGRINHKFDSALVEGTWGSSYGGGSHVNQNGINPSYSDPTDNTTYNRGHGSLKIKFMDN